MKYLLPLMLAASFGGAASATTISGIGSPVAAIPGGTVEGFDSTTAGLYSALTFGNVTITSIGDPFTIGTDFNGSYNTSGGQSLYNDFDYTPLSFRFDFATAVDAFAFNWGASDYVWYLDAFDSVGTLLDTLAISPTYGSGAGEYFGIAATGISYATLFTTSGDYVFIDNFTSGAVAPIPVPASLPLLLAGLGALVAFGRKRRA